MILDRLRRELSWRWKLAARRRYLRRAFRNGDELFHSLVSKTPCDTAVGQDGVVIRHPAGRSGLALMIAEVWFEQVYSRRFYAPKPGDVIIDAGANIGLFSLLMARMQPDSRILAFEPFAENFEILQANLAAANAARVEPFQFALSGASGTCTMQDGGKRSQDHRLIEGAASGGADSVSTVSFAGVLDRARAESIAMFKCDIEGSEYDLFQTADLKDIKRVKRFAIEFHNNIRPGTLDLLQQRLSESHHVVIRPEGYEIAETYGTLYATARELGKAA